MSKRLTFVTILVSAFSHTWSQTPIYRFKNWNSSQGLSGNICLSMLQDSKGFIWIGTTNGLNRFSGTTIRQETGYGIESEILSDEIRGMSSDSAGVIWIASPNHGLVAFDQRKEYGSRISVYTIPELRESATPATIVTKVFVDRNNNVWVGVENNGLYQFDRGSQKFVKWNLTHPYSNFAQSIRGFYQHSDGKIWVGIVNGLVVIDPFRRETIYPKLEVENLIYSGPPTIRKVIHWNKDSFVVATDRGAHFYISSTNRIAPVFDLKDSVQLKNEGYNDVIKISNDELWFASTSNGLLVINPTTKKFHHEHQFGETGRTVLADRMFQLFRDRTNRIWMAHQRGFSLLDSQSQVFVNRQVAPKKIRSDEESIAIDNSGQIYFTQTDNVYRLLPRISDTAFAIQGTVPRARYIKYIPGKGIFLQNNTGFYMYHEKRESITKLPLDTSAWTSTFRPLLNSPIADMIVDTLNGREIAWLVGLINGCLFSYEWATGKLTPYKSSIHAHAVRDNYGVAFRKVKKDPKGGLWLASVNRGIFYIPDRSKDEGVLYSSTSTNGKYFPANSVMDLFFDSHHDLWASLKGKGLAKIDWRRPQTLSYEIFGREHGLNTLSLHRIIEDKMGHLWMSSQNGLYCFYPKEQWFRHFGAYHGIEDDAFNLGNGTDSSGKLFFATDGSIVEFDPADALKAKRVPDLHLSQMITPRRSFDIENNSVLQLEANENSFTVVFDLVDYEANGERTVMYKMDGYEDRWQLIRNLYEINATNLPGGQYTLRLKQVNLQGVAEEQVSLQIYIPDVFYKTLWFKLVVITVSLLLIVAMVRSYTNRKLLKQQHYFEQQRALQNERLRISSELHDDLGGELSTIRLMAEIMQTPGMTEGTGDYLRHISDKSQQLVHNMNEIVWSLNYHNDNLEGTLGYIRQYAVRYLQNAGIDVSFDLPAIMPIININGSARRHLFLLVKEALHNIVKHAEAETVRMEATLTNEFVITIKDDGKGIANEEPAELAIGNGLRNMRERADMLHGRLEIKNNDGTEICISIPTASFHTKV